jgi:hypothetical protein
VTPPALPHAGGCCVLLQCSISTGNAWPEGPATRASLLLRLRDTKDAETWRQFVAVHAAVVYGFARKRGPDADAADPVISRRKKLWPKPSLGKNVLSVVIGRAMRLRN